MVDPECSAEGVLGLSYGVYRGSVSTESGPWCLQIKGGGGSRMGSVVRGESGGGSTTVCGRSSTESVQSVVRYEAENIRTLRKVPFSFLRSLA